MINFIIQALFKLQFNSIWSRKRSDKESTICLTPKPSQSFFVNRIPSKEKFSFYRRRVFKEKAWWRIEQNKLKEDFLTALVTGIMKGTTTSIRKHANELKVNEKTVRRAIKQYLSPDHNPLDFAIWSFLENKTNATSNRNIGSLKTAFDEEWNKMS